jgi:hypothetical protein
MGRLYDFCTAGLREKIEQSQELKKRLPELSAGAIMTGTRRRTCVYGSGGADI